jgi:hypothetical protein
MIYNYIEPKFNRLLLDGRAIGMGYSMGYWSWSSLGMPLYLLLFEETLAWAVLCAVGRAVA